MYAIIETGGKQVKVEVGQTIFVEKVDAKVDEKFTFDKVLVIKDANTTFGDPYIKGAKVVAKVFKQGFESKVRVYKYKAKANERKRIGHRQPYTALTIESISL